MNVAGEIYTSEKLGCDEGGDGSEGRPFKTLLQAMRHAGKEPFPTIYVDSKEEGKVSLRSKPFSLQLLLTGPYTDQYQIRKYLNGSKL